MAEKKTLEGKFVTGRELDEIARIHDVVLLRIKKPNFYRCKIDKIEHYLLERCPGKPERYNILEYRSLK